MAKLTADQMLQRAHVSLMRSKQFCCLSSIVMCGKSEIKDDVPTAYTDGWNASYGRKFFEGLDEKGRAAVVAHENFHKMLQQLRVWEKLFKDNAQCANMAADYVINLMIEDLDPSHSVCKLPSGALLDRRFAGMNTKQVFDLLKKEGKSGGGGGNSTEKGDKSGGANGAPSDGCMDDHGWGGEEVSEKEQQQREQMLDQAIRQGQILAGKMGSGGNRVINELLEPKVNWREQLREFVHSTCSGRDTSTWRRPNRRYLGMDVYMPSMQSETMGDLIIGIDTSGSIGQEMINLFAAELRGICETVIPAKVCVLWWDTRVCSVQEFEPHEYERISSLLKPAGGGGTDPRCVFEWVAKRPTRPEACVMLTDGYIGSDWGTQPEYPVMWAITSNHKSPWGVSIKLED